MAINEIAEKVARLSDLSRGRILSRILVVVRKVSQTSETMKDAQIGAAMVRSSSMLYENIMSQDVAVSRQLQ